MKRRVFLGLLCSMVVGASIQEQSREAQAFLEGGEPKRACAIYQELLSRSLTAPERQVALYNLATAQLADHQLEAARAHLKEVVQETEEDPTLLYRAHTNFAHCCLQLSEEIPKEPEQVCARYDAMLSVLQAGLQGCELAQQCSMEAYQECAADLVALRSAMKQNADRWSQALAAARTQEGLTALQKKLACRTQKLEWAVAAKQPILEQLAVLSQKLLPFWKDAEAQVAPEEVAHRRLDQAKSHAQKSTEALQCACGEQALEEQYGAMLAVQGAEHALASAKGQLESLLLEPLLTERCEIARRWERAGRQEGYASCLGRIERQYRETAQQLLRDEKGDDPLADALLDRLVRRMAWEPKEAQKAIVFSDDDLWLYRQIAEKEEVAMARLCADLKRGVWPEQVSARVEALREKVAARLELCDDPAQMQRLQRVHQPLDDAAALATQSPSSSTRQLLELIESALCAWSPSAWLQNYIEDWKGQCDVSVQNGAVSPGFLEEILEKQHQVQAKLGEKEGTWGPHMQCAMCDLEKACEQELSTHAMLFVQDAARELGWALEDFSAQSVPHLVSLLEQMIAEQEFVQNLTKRAALGARRDPPSGGMREMLCNAQDRVAERSAPFPMALALLEQEPNPQAVKLVQEGIEEAARTRRHLEGEQVEWAQADFCQDLALTKWREALQLFEEEGSSGTSTEGGDQGDGGGADNGEEQSGPEHRLSSAELTELFDLLQRMDCEDREGKEEGRTPRQGDRPW